jgi:hypothetical protein
MEISKIIENTRVWIEKAMTDPETVTIPSKDVAVAILILQTDKTTDEDIKLEAESIIKEHSTEPTPTGISIESHACLLLLKHDNDFPLYVHAKLLNMK